jgi:hypothetical protein
MKTHLHPSAFAAILALAAAAPVVRAATVIPGYNNSTGDSDTPFHYLAKATFGQFDSWATAITPTPGTWSFANLDPAENPNAGWGHTTRWYLVELTAASNFTLSMTTTSTSANPGFVIYAGESVNDVPGAMHTYSNNGQDLALLNDPWNTNGDLTYLGNAYNGKVTRLSKSFNLAAGLYSIGFGNAADPADLPSSAIPYDVTFTSIPEPSAAFLLGFTALLALRRQRD